jgi:hypothetical protein
LFALIGFFFVGMTKIYYKVDLTAAGGDYGQHYRNAKNLPAVNGLEMGEYAPLNKFFSQFFSFSQQGFFLYVLLLLALITPFLLYKLKGSFTIVWMYFASISYFWLLSSSGFISQALLGIWVLLYLLQKNWLVKLFLVVTAVFVHGYGLMLMFAVMIVDLLFEKRLFGKIHFSCSALLPASLKAQFSQGIGVIPDNLNLSELLNFLTRGFPLPFLIVSSFQLWTYSKKLLLMGVAVAFSSLYVNMGYRILAFSELFFLFGLAEYYNQASKYPRYLIMVFSILALILNAYSWHTAFLNLSNAC